MPILIHKEPCVECPFLRKSAPGWLGTSSPKQFITTVMLECEMPCHMFIDYDRENWLEEQYPQAPICAGSLIFFRNTMKMPRIEKLLEYTKLVKSNTKAVFQWQNEFVAHHTTRTNTGHDT